MPTPTTTTDRTPTERIAREQILGLVNEIAALVDPANDGNRAAWELAAVKASEIRHSCLITADAIQTRPLRNVNAVFSAALGMVRPA